MAIEPIGPQSVTKTQEGYPWTLGLEKEEKTFSETLKDSILKVNDVQMQADQSIVDLTTGKNTDLHQTMIAIEKAEVTFQLMMQVRNKLMSAYEEVSRMQV
ncbi:MAG: flagellar hook-basal body complex protein FliE [Nitrospirae bacterium]|nr:flagellar hook-basal body complex protein FliE [Candidatus Troglogloeales bacterium]